MCIVRDLVNTNTTSLTSQNNLNRSYRCVCRSGFYAPKYALSYDIYTIKKTHKFLIYRSLIIFVVDNIQQFYVVKKAEYQRATTSAEREGFEPDSLRNLFSMIWLVCYWRGTELSTWQFGNELIQI